MGGRIFEMCVIHTLDTLPAGSLENVCESHNMPRGPSVFQPPRRRDLAAPVRSIDGHTATQLQPSPATMSNLTLPSRALWLLPVLFAAHAHAALPEGALYTSTRDAIHFHGADLTVAKEAGPLRFDRIFEMGANPDVQLVFQNHDKGIVSIITVYPAPPGTAGPAILLDEDGEPTLADDSDNPYAVFQLSEPSEIFLREFDRAVEYVERRYGFEMTNRNRQPMRKLAAPADLENSPIAYVADFRGNGGFRHPDLADYPWSWDFRLFAVRDHFVKIHTEGPESFATFGASREMVEAFRWLPDVRGGGE